ncbi:uncharacterized protein Gasu_22490 [Galdieria sulphuraria]|uniref:DUF1682 family protein n=1 Tax=Galdieria sulphuraria TaxID=130081 RepID=M2X1Y0_GALSU|nr:uncharacterized protein Gasu_22490 [Galdieria sulphuraria]EME30340.1 hypothetical protein Gasu_22490 [Galdieria sulphuraria]|eukprot:XP_005706860.1 hypothetical protein Gasu_22490 [Galdieria sulphuraria]
MIQFVKANLFLGLLIWMLVATSSGESIESPKTETLTQQSKNETAIPRQQWKRAPLTAVDAFYAGIALVYLLFFGLGTWRNLNISKQLGQLLSSCASSQFAWTGVDKDGKLLYQDGIANYIFYASGRRYITWLKCELELKHRQDPFFYFRRPFENRWNMRDRLHIRVSLSKENLAPLTFCLIKARGAKRFRSEHKDVENYCESFSSYLSTLNVPALGKFELYSESLELARKILAEDRMLQILNKYGHLIQRIYICEETSKSSNENETLKKWIDIQSIIPSDFTGVQDFLLLACWLSDYISTVQLSAGVLQRSEKLRNMVKEDEEKAKEKKRKEQILKEKQEKKQQDTSDVFSLSRSAQKKLEEKQRKAELKKKSKKGFRFLAV